jgi:hypothetical protein
MKMPKASVMFLLMAVTAEAQSERRMASGEPMAAI